MTEKQSPADALAWAAGTIAIQYFQADNLPMGKRLPTLYQMERLLEVLAAYRSAPAMPSPERVLEAMETFDRLSLLAIVPEGKLDAAIQVLSELRKAVKPR